MRSTSLTLILLLPLCGCVDLEREAPERMRYLLDVGQTGEGTPGDGGALPSFRLVVHRPHVAAPFATQGFVTRHEGEVWQEDFYNEFLIPPADMLHDLLLTRLRGGGLFEAVRTGSSRLLPTHELEVDVTALYGDYRDDPPEAVLAMHILLLPRESHAALMNRTYEARMPLGDRDPQALVQAWNRALGRIMTRLEADLRESLGTASGGDS